MQTTLPLLGNPLEPGEGEDTQCCHPTAGTAGAGPGKRDLGFHSSTSLLKAHSLPSIDR